MEAAVPVSRLADIPGIGVDAMGNAADRLASAEMLRQNQMGVKPTISMAAMPTPKRFICGSAHVVGSPPATE